MLEPLAAASAFEQALLSLDRLAARNILLESGGSETSLQRVERLVVPALERIGAGWEQGQVALSQVYMVFDLIGSLPRTMTEAKAIENVFELFAMLCAPTSLVYVPFVGSQPGNALSRPAEQSVGDAIPARLAGFREDYAWTESGNGFVLRISHQDETLGVLEIEGLAFPQHKQHYLNLALAVVQVCGLAIANARSYQELERLVEELEKSLAQRKRAEEALQQRNRDLDLFSRVSQTLVATLDPQEVTERLMRALTQAIGAEGSSVWMWDEEQPGGLVCHGAAYPGLKRSLIGLRLRPGEGIAGWVAEQDVRHRSPCLRRSSFFARH